MEKAVTDKWTEWMKCKTSEERFIRMFQAEQDQIEVKDDKTCRLIYVRGKLVGAVDFKTEVRLKLHPETSPSLSFTRRGEGLFVSVYLHQWEH